MQRVLAIAVLLCATCVPVLAQEMPQMPQEEAMPSLTKTNPDGSVTVDEKALAGSLCQSMQILSSPDLNGIPMPERMDMPVTASDLKKMGVNQPVNSGQTMIVSILKGGRVLVNEQDVTPVIHGFCASHGMSLTPAPAKVPAQ